MKKGATVDPGNALRTLLARSPSILAIAGTTRIAHLEDNAAALEARHVWGSDQMSIGRADNHGFAVRP
ncbi:hypothetical protein [uncultured Roseobacter sp.]|uniref:hypothetical protein n=1 Tax=uncultured Roseobacter sp. TaxID=114847 RepID=UPI002639D2B1|nr:hypothetical protein [uncultured Roseobacter sp.]